MCYTALMDKRTITCCFTGHRAEKLPWKYNETDPGCLALKEKLRDVLSALYGAGYRHFICGMATGGDLYFGEAVVALREEHPDVTLEAAIPFEGQSAQWPDDTRRRYFRLAEDCDRQTVLHHSYTPDCMMDRNRYMVDNSGLLIAVYNGSPGGTRNTMLYAIRQGVEILQLDI